MNEEALGVVFVAKKALRRVLGLDTEFKPSVVYDKYSDTIVVKVFKNYKVPLQCPGKTYIILFQEDCDDAGKKDIAGFQIDDVSRLCRKYNLQIESSLKISEVLQALLAEKIGLCEEVAVNLALKLLYKHCLDEVKFPDF